MVTSHITRDHGVLSRIKRLTDLSCERQIKNCRFALHDMVGEVARCLQAGQRILSMLVQVRVPEKFLVDGAGAHVCNGIYSRIGAGHPAYPHPPRRDGISPSTPAAIADVGREAALQSAWKHGFLCADPSCAVFLNAREPFVLCALTLPRFCAFLAPAAAQVSHPFFFVAVLSMPLL